MIMLLLSVTNRKFGEPIVPALSECVFIYFHILAEYVSFSLNSLLLFAVHHISLDFSQSLHFPNLKLTNIPVPLNRKFTPI